MIKGSTYKMSDEGKHNMVLAWKLRSRNKYPYRKYSRISWVWRAMKVRCSYPKNPKFYLYGARGIKVEWHSFEEFMNDMYESYLIHKKEHSGRNTTIERIDGNGNYCKENCKWATYAEQNKNLVINYK